MFERKQIIRLVLLTSWSVVVGCGEQKEAPNQLFGPTPVDDTKSPGFCSRQPNEGDNLMGFFASQSNLQNSGYFGKKLPLGQLEAALSASAHSVAKALVAENVRLFSIRVNPQARCEYFSFLQSADQQASQRWNRFSTNNTPSNSLLGLFTTLYQQTGSGTRLINPTIVVRKDSQKWTLLHEMTHYLFAKARVQRPNMPFKSVLQTRITQLNRDIQQARLQYSRQPERRNARRLARLWNELFRSHLALDRRGALEELAIEALLFERGINNRIDGINLNSDLGNSMNYMRTNGRLARSTYELMAQRMDLLISELESNNNRSAARGLSQTRNRAENVVQSIDRTLSRFESTLRNQISSATLQAESHEANNSLDDHKETHVHFDKADLIKRREMIREL